MELTKKERLIIANQLKILEKLYPEEADYYAKNRKALEEGYGLHYSSLTDHFYEEMSKEKCQEVLDILDMYRAITYSYQSLEDKSEINQCWLRFRGFDGNNEGKQCSYTQYFILDLGRFEELKYGNKYPNFNSHAQVLDKYRRMLAVWESFDKKWEIDKDRLIQVLEA